MRRYILRRLSIAIPTLLGVTVVVFVITHLIPGDPAVALVGENGTPAQYALAREYLKLDLPIYQQYLSYLGGLLRGDLGLNIQGRSVVAEFATRFPATVELTLCALTYAVVLGIPLGRLAARHRGRLLDLLFSGIGLLGIAVPSFVLGLVLQYVLAVKLGILPATGRLDARLALPNPTNFMLIDTLLAGRLDAFIDAARHLILPAITLGSLPLAYVMRLTRASVLEASTEDYVRTARGKGLPERQVVNQHIMPNAWLPVVTIVGLQVGHLLSGAVITETVFAWNGAGSWVVQSIQRHDFIVVQSAVLIFAIIFLVVNLIVDVSYAVLDPRIRYE